MTKSCAQWDKEEEEEGDDLMELLAPFGGNFANPDDGLGIVTIDMKNGRLGKL